MNTNERERGGIWREVRGQRSEVSGHLSLALSPRGGEGMNFGGGRLSEASLPRTENNNNKTGTKR